MLVIESRNVDGQRLTHSFDNRFEFLKDAASDEPKMGDNEILLVREDTVVLYSSLGRQQETYTDTVRTSDLVGWLS